MYDVGWCRCALTIWPGTEAPELSRAHYARLSARSLDGLAYWDVLADAIILKNKRNWLAMYHSLGVNISGDLFGRRATAFIDDAFALARRLARRGWRRPHFLGHRTCA